MLPYDYGADSNDVPGIVYIVDDDLDVRDSLKWLLEANDYRVEDYESGETFIAQFNENVPSVILCDLRMPGMSGADVQDHLLKRRVDAPFIFITGHGDVPQAVEAFKKGAVDFIQKPFKQQQVKELVNRMLERAREIRRRRLEMLQNRSLIEKLTPREQQVLDRIVHGRLNKQIADDLGISIKTVEAHRASIMDKTGSGTVADLMRVVLKSELFPQLSSTLAEIVSSLPGHTAETGLPHSTEAEERVLRHDRYPGSRY
ncbi:response regulator transcription factor [Sutterella megalosphaeroides]|uniref:DNA-binding response regulator n=1 Tax=Sutterella megalosphaeroides TaxID=2494234 RepID=A0A2Z6IAM2_9BURK|nr:hypothetical protein SUTMEG_05380 [Sutterella megalosphaeroides]